MRWVKATTFLLAIAISLAGCTRDRYFRQADKEANSLVVEKAHELDWPMPDFDVDPDPRSRYHDVYSQVRPPMPSDDAVSHRYMRGVDGHRGYAHWEEDGARDFLDNPNWQVQLASYCELNDAGAVLLSLPSSVSLARVHSPDILRQMETVYLSALDVSAERFGFDLQYFAGNDSTLTHLGRLRNPNVGERNQLATDTDALIRRRFTTAGELLVGFANSFVWQFAGSDTNQTFSLLNFTMVQPLLRGAYRNVAMEDLTQAERSLLANLRALERYHQGFLTNLVIGELGVLGPQRTRTDPENFSGNVDAAIRLETLVSQAGSSSVTAPNRALTTGFVTATGARLQGFLGLLQQYQEIRNSRQILSAQQRAVRLLEAHLAAGNIELIRVDEFRQTVEVERNNLLELETRLQTTLDEYKVNKLGLPSDLEVALDPSLIEPVNLNSETSLQIQSRSQSIQSDVRRILMEGADVDVNAWIDELRATVSLALSHVADLKRQHAVDLLPSVSVQELPAPFAADEPAATGQLSTPWGQSLQSLVPMTPAAFLERIEQRLVSLREETGSLSVLQLPRDEAKSTIVRFSQQLSEISDLIYLTEVRVRLAKVQLPVPGITSNEAFGIASQNRLDWMNARASVVDQWRQINLQANRLKSDMDIFVSGDVGTNGNNPAKFRGPTGTLRLGVRFDGALTRLLERNAFRESIIEYQRSRRDFIRFQDTIGRNLRRVLREMDQLQRSFEIQRNSVEIAVRRVDVSLQSLNRPPVPAPAGAPNNQLSPNASFSMLTALGDLRASKDNILNVWLSYQAARLLLARDLGVMGMDVDALWLDSLELLPGCQSSVELLETAPQWYDFPPEVLLEELPPVVVPTNSIGLDGSLLLDHGVVQPAPYEILPTVPNSPFELPVSRAVKPSFE